MSAAKKDSTEQTQKEQNLEDKAEQKIEENNQEPQSDIAKLEEEKNQLNDKLLRALAELENTRRRSKEEIEKTAKFALSNFANDLILVVENFFLASDNAPKEELEKSAATKGYFDAMLMTQKELIKLLEKNNIKRIFPLNEKFDHNFHEAISQLESDKEEGTVIQVVQAGYAISERLIRPALVAVSKGK